MAHNPTVEEIVRSFTTTTVQKKPRYLTASVDIERRHGVTTKEYDGLLDRNSELEQKVQDLVERNQQLQIDLESEKEERSDLINQLIEHSQLETDMKRLRSQINRRSFILVLINADADGYVVSPIESKC
ncbi:MAG: hypothetical protein Q9166_004762 [cf. Caloplaca sp. 2 TL-2023]